MQPNFEACAFFGIKNKRRLAGVLKAPLSALKSISKLHQAHYTEFELESGRKCEVPNPFLKEIQGKIVVSLEAIAKPDSLYSPKKGKSYVDNAAAHQGGKHMLKTDISKFFQNCRRNYVMAFFKDDLAMSEDCAWLLTDLVTYNGHLPTGAPTSPILSYWAYARAFRKIDEAAVKEAVTFTQYVDDLVFSSGKAISHKFQLKITRQIRDVGLNIKKKKTHRLGPGTHKVVTGVAISPDGKLEVPHSLSKKIFKPFKKGKKIGQLSLKETQQALGRVRSARTIDPKAFPTLYSELGVRDQELRKTAAEKKL